MKMTLLAAAGPTETSSVAHPCRTDHDRSHRSVARRILSELMRYRRIAGDDAPCELGCRKCHAPHIEKIVACLKNGEPLVLVLPAFPGKSPNPAKVLGPLPDMAEQRALQFLNSVCQRLELLHPPGVRMVLCSDGRVFSDVVGMDEAHVTRYQDELDAMITSLELSHISTFNLDQVFERADFDTMRASLMARYGTSLETLQETVRRGAKSPDDADARQAHRMYCGITRFLFEDACHPNQTQSRSSLQRECRQRAYEVIRRSNAWSGFVAEQFPNAIRLSIHPQACGSEKFGIRMFGSESWMTPWHGVALDSGKEFVIVKRTEAEAMGARLVMSEEGRPSHFELVV